MSRRKGIDRGAMLREASRYHSINKRVRGFEASQIDLEHPGRVDGA